MDQGNDNGRPVGRGAQFTVVSASVRKSRRQNPSSVTPLYDPPVTRVAKVSLSLLERVLPESAERFSFQIFNIHLVHRVELFKKFSIKIRDVDNTRGNM